MNNSEVKVKLLDERNKHGNKVNRHRLCFIIAICVTSSIALSTYLAWNEFYQVSLKIPPRLVDIPLWYLNRSQRIEDTEMIVRTNGDKQKDTKLNSTFVNKNLQRKSVNEDVDKKLVCYYSYPDVRHESNLYLKNIDPHLCTHLNVGIVSLVDNELYIDDKIKHLLNGTRTLKDKNKNLKVLLWVGGANSKGFPEMVTKHATRKVFIKSLRNTLKMYHLDGVDLDWEFPTAYRKERQHFTQLLHEIRWEYQREHRNYLLSVAAAAPEGIVYFAYDISEINIYVDYVNIMTYDYHFFSKSSPFTGLNAPLFARHNEHSLLSTLNINYTVNYWLKHGLDKSKIVVGLPTYGHSFRDNYNWLRLCIFIAICAASSIAVYSTWNAIYQHSLNIPSKFADIPLRYYYRAELYSETFYKNKPYSRDNLNLKEFLHVNGTQNVKYKQIGNERIYPSANGTFIYKQNDGLKLVCYYEAPNSTESTNIFYLSKIDPHLCTHLNVGIINVFRNRLYLDDRIKKVFMETKALKRRNKDLKVLLWVGGFNSKEFSEMVAHGETRRAFIISLKSVLEKYCLDGIDIDWEFPHAGERQHFSQLLHEIRREYERTHRTYLLSVAVAAPEEIIYYSYEIQEINNYTDYFNVMTFDYHFYTKNTSMTGLNAPLFARQSEHALQATLNINYTIQYLQSRGMDKRKIIVGLPTYGHTFGLVNPFNTGIGSPAQGYGRVGSLGFASYSEVCWFKQNNIYLTTVYDVETCSPYLYASTEWISYEDERSLECKANYIKSNGFGGAMIFSLNTDDYDSHCEIGKNKVDNSENTNSSFPLVRKIYSVLFDK